MIFKKLFPKSLYKRFIIIIAFPIIIIQLVSLYVFYYTHLDIVSKYMSQINAGEINFIVKNYDNLSKNNLINNISQNFKINITRTNFC